MEGAASRGRLLRRTRAARTEQMKFIVNPPTPWPNWQAPVGTERRILPGGAGPLAGWLIGKIRWQVAVVPSRGLSVLSISDFPSSSYANFYSTKRKSAKNASEDSSLQLISYLSIFASNFWMVVALVRCHDGWYLDGITSATTI